MGMRELWKGMRVLSDEEIEALGKSGDLTGFFSLYPDGTEAEIDAGYEMEAVTDFLRRGGSIGEEMSDTKTRCVEKIEDGSVDKLIEVLERFRGKKVCLMGASEIYVHISGDTVILDEENLEDTYG